ncbi:MAG: TIR domain-containing protein [Lachnospiraceae bacterium]
MNLEEKQYDAFISYRHSDLDQYVAVTLHKELEAFRIPKNMVKQLQKNGITKKRINRVFRDRDELPITNNLADPITNALRNSEYLLVICTPRLPESIWCKTEVETFIKMHGREHVFAVLAEGEPQDSFPQALLFDEKEVTDENGNKSIVTVPIEPLAADVRGKNKKEIHKKIKEEVIRLAAPMFSCSYDDLKQRHREQKIRRITTISLSVAAVFAAFAVVSTTMAVRIHSQSKQIAKQAEQINEQYQEALKTNARGMADDSRELLERGDRKEAVRLAYEALTGTQEEPMPYTSEAEYALSEALQVYRNNNCIVPSRLLEQNSAISFSKVSPDGSKVMVADIFGTITVFDPLTGEKLYEVETEGNHIYMNEWQAAFISEDTIAYPGEKGVVVYNFVTGETKQAGDKAVYMMAVDKEGNYLLTEMYDSVIIYALDDMSVAYALESNAGETFGNEAAFSKDAQYVACEFDTVENGSGIYIINLQTGEQREYLADHMGITDIVFDGENIYFTSYGDIQTMNSRITCVTADGKMLWKKELENCIADTLRIFGEGEMPYLAYCTYSVLGVLDKTNGEKICSTDVAEEIVNYATYNDSNLLTAMTRSGEFHFYNTENDLDLIMEGKFTANSDNIKEFRYGSGFYTSFAYQDTALTVYEFAKGEKLTDFMNPKESPLSMKANSDESLLAWEILTDDGRTIQIVSADEKKIVKEFVIEDYVIDYCFNQNDKLVVLTGNEILVYDVNSGKEISSLAYEEKLGEYVSVNSGFFVANGNKVVVDDHNSIYVLNADDASLLYQIEEEDLSVNGSAIYAFDRSGEHYAYSSKKEKCIIFGSSQNEMKQKIDVNINCVTNLSFDSENMELYVTYLDNSLEVYEFETGKLLRKYTTLTDKTQEVITLPQQQHILLVTPSNTYLLNEDKEIIGCIEGFKAFRNKTNTFMIKATTALYEVPLYDLNMLLEEGKKFLE